MAKFKITVIRKSVGVVEVEANTAVQAKARIYAMFEGGKVLKAEKPWKESVQIRHAEKV